MYIDDKEIENAIKFTSKELYCSRNMCNKDVSSSARYFFKRGKFIIFENLYKVRMTCIFPNKTINAAKTS